MQVIKLKQGRNKKIPAGECREQRIEESECARARQPAVLVVIWHSHSHTNEVYIYTNVSGEC
jgi:hypothetical protein